MSFICFTSLLQHFPKPPLNFSILAFHRFLSILKYHSFASLCHLSSGVSLTHIYYPVFSFFSFLIVRRKKLDILFSFPLMYWVSFLAPTIFSLFSLIYLHTLYNILPSYSAAFPFLLCHSSKFYLLVFIYYFLFNFMAVWIHLPSLSWSF